MSDKPLIERTSRQLPRTLGRSTDRSAAAAGAVVGASLTAAIFLGSRHLEHFDVALLGYAIGTVFLAAGGTYRTVVWAKSPPARRYLALGMKALLRPGPAAPAGEAPRTLVSTLLLQRFIANRSTGQWLAHQGLFWGVVTASLITFPLTFGWIYFRAAEGSAGAYRAYVMGIRTLAFDALSLAGFLVFHALDISALLVIGGVCFYLYKRWPERHNNLTKLGRDLLPLIALMAISVTGLALTVSSLWMGGFGYRPMAFIHMCTVVLTLIWIPFGKFFHTIQRPAMIGVQLYKQAGLASGGAQACRICGEPVEGAVFIEDLRKTMDELGLEYAGWTETCPRCKRMQRGAQYREQVKAGF